MRTTIKRLRTKDEAQANQYCLKLRRQGRLAWAEATGDQHFLCLRVEIVRVGVPIAPQNYRDN